MKTKPKRPFKNRKYRPKTMEIKIMPFKRDETDEILNIVNATLDDRNNIVYDGKIVICEGCGKAINKNHLGSVIPSSEHFICDNPICFYIYHVEHGKDVK